MFEDLGGVLVEVFLTDVADYVAFVREAAGNDVVVSLFKADVVVFAVG